MKHDLRVTLVLVGLFLAVQLIGLGTVNSYIKVEKDINGTITIEHPDTVICPQPEIERKEFSFIPVVIAILVGTALVFLLIRFRLQRVWKYWFLFAVWITMSVFFGVYIAKYIAITIGLVLALMKIFKPNVFIHNITEIFVYSGITILLLPLLNIVSGFLILFFISIYDMYAVWKSKHMIKLAKFQTKNKIFAGLFIPYKKEKRAKKEIKPKLVKSKGKIAILGGGDLAFPLIFSAAVMENLILVKGIVKSIAFLETLIITLFVSIALLLLFFKGKKDRFYPAMPFLSIGCAIGYLVILLINFFIFI